MELWTAEKLCCPHETGRIRWTTEESNATQCTSTSGVCTNYQPCNFTNATNCSVSFPIGQSAQCFALCELYQAIGGSAWTDTKWGSADPVCGSGRPFLAPWHGIKCEDNKVTSLQLVDTQLNGSTVIGLSMVLSGSVPSSLVSLSMLQTLSLKGIKDPNRAYALSGSIPSTIGVLTELKALTMQFTRISSSIPRTLYQLSTLETMNLQTGALSGTVSESLGAFSILREFKIGSNPTSGTVPSSLESLKSLKYLWYRSWGLTNDTD